MMWVLFCLIVHIITYHLLLDDFVPNWLINNQKSTITESERSPWFRFFTYCSFQHLSVKIILIVFLSKANITLVFISILGSGVKSWVVNIQIVYFTDHLKILIVKTFKKSNEIWTYLNNYFQPFIIFIFRA